MQELIFSDKKYVTRLDNFDTNRNGNVARTLISVVAINKVPTN